MKCIVFDCVFKGLYQPNLGVFSIDLGRFLEKTQQKIKRRAEKEQGIIKEQKPVLEPLLPQESEKIESSFRRPSEEEKLVDTSNVHEPLARKAGPYSPLVEESPSIPVAIEMQVHYKALEFPVFSSNFLRKSSTSSRTSPVLCSSRSSRRKGRS